MGKVSLWVLGVALLGGLSGCGTKAPPPGKKDPLAEKIAAINKVTSILEGIKDDATAEAALPRLEKPVTQFQEAGKKLKSMMSTSKEEADKLVVKYGLELVGALMKVQAATERAGKAAPGKKDKILELLRKEETTGK
jgi:hypothetical protein